MECLISQARVSWGKLLTKCRYYEMVVSTGKNIIYVDDHEGNQGDDMNWTQTVSPKFEDQWCFNEVGNGHYVKYFASKSGCNDFSMNMAWNNGAHLELWQQWRNRPHCFWHWNLYHLVHVQVWRWSRRQISCPETPLQIFRYEYPLQTTKRTLSYGRSENCDRAASHAGIFITECTSNCGDDLIVKYVVPIALCKWLGMNIPWKQRSAPWTIAAMKISTALHLTLECLAPSARPTVATISVWRRFPQTPAGNISEWVCCENNRVHLEPWRRRRKWSCHFWRWNFDHLVRVRVQRRP